MNNLNQNPLSQRHILSPKDIDQNLEEENDKNLFTINLTDLNIDDYKDLFKNNTPLELESKTKGNNNEGKKVIVTILDLFNISTENKDEIINVVNNKLKIDINEKSGIKEINRLFEIALKLYKERYLKKLPTIIENKKFTNAESVVDFLLQTKKNKIFGIIYCLMAKMTYVVNDILKSPHESRAAMLDRQFINKYLERPLQIEKTYEDEDQKNIIHKGRASFSLINYSDNLLKVEIVDKIVKFKLISRQKGFSSIAGKTIANPEYHTINKFKDLIGVTFYVDTKEDAIYLMQYLAPIVFGDEYQIKNHGLIKKEDIKENLLNPAFKEKIVNAINEPSSKKETTSEGYKDIKIMGTAKLKLESGEKTALSSIGTEIKFITKGSDDEKGLNVQYVYDYQKRFIELSRLGIPIKKIDVMKYVNDFFLNLDENLNFKNKNREEFIIELYEDLKKTNLLGDYSAHDIKKIDEKKIAIGLYNYFMKLLIEVKLPGKNKKSFFVTKNIIDLKSIGYYRDDLEVLPGEQ